MTTKEQWQSMAVILIEVLDHLSKEEVDIPLIHWCRIINAQELYADLYKESLDDN